jgi:hypothetical protein
MSQGPGSPYATSAAFDLAGNACPGGTVKEADYIQVALEDSYVPMFPIHFSGYKPATATLAAGYQMTATAGVRTS